MTTSTTRPRRRLLIVCIVLACATLAGGAGLAIALDDPPSLPTNLPPDKQQVLDQEQAAADAAPATPDLAAGPPDSGATLPPRKPGIVDTNINQGPFPGSEFTVDNVWAGPVAGRWYLVYAGVFLDPGGEPAQGGVRIYSEPIDPNADDQGLQPVGDYPATTPTALTITDGHGHTLELQSTDGSSLTFDMATGAYDG